MRNHYLILLLSLVYSGISNAASFATINAKVCTQSYTPVSNMVISEAAAVADFGTVGTATTNNLLFINAPSGFEFNPGTGSVNHAGTGNITSSSVLFVSASTIAISYNVDNNTTLKTDVLTISGIQVKASSVSGTTGNATVGAGSTTIVGVTNGSTNVASFQSAITAITYANTTACNNTGLVALSGSHTLAAGVSLNSTSYSGSNVSGSNFNSTAAGAGSHSTSYVVMTTGPSCTFTVSNTIDVNAAPTVTISSAETAGLTPNDNTICTGSPVTFTANGANSYQFKVNGANGSGASTVTPYTNSSLANGNTVSVVGTSSNGCSATSSNINITVNSLPGGVTFNPSRTAFAETEDGFRLDTMDSPSPFAANPWSTSSYFTGVGVVQGSGANTGFDYFFPSVAGAGYNDVITYHYVDVNGCEATAVSNFTVSGTSGTNFGGLNSSYCINGASTTMYVPHTRLSLYSGCGSWLCFANFTFDHFEYYNPVYASWTVMTSTYNAGQSRDEATFNPAVIGSYFNGGTGLRDLRAVYVYGGNQIYTTAQTTINSLPTFYITNTWNYETPCQAWADSALTFSSLNGITINSYSSSPAGLLTYVSGNYMIDWGAASYYPSYSTYTFNIQDVATACQNTRSFYLGVAAKPATPTVTSVTDKCVGDNVQNLSGDVTMGPYGYTLSAWFRKDNATNTNVLSRYVYGTAGASVTDYYSPGVMLASDTFYLQHYIYSSCRSDFSAPIIVKVNTPATVDAGNYGNVCSSSPTVTLAGTRNPGALGITWSKPAGANGTFSVTPDINATNPSYTAGSSEIANGKIKLYLTTADPDGVGIGCAPSKDSTEIIINPEALITAGTPTTYCSNNNILLSGTVGGSTSSVTWYKNSVGGSQVDILDPTNLATYYTLSPSEKSGGVLTFVIESNDPDGPTGPCPKVNAPVNITISPEPVVSAGTSGYTCGSANVPLSGTCVKIGGADLNATWKKGTWSSYVTTTGAAKNATYTPSGSEALGGGYVYWLVSDDPDGAGPCLADSSSVIHTINPGAFVNAGAPSTWCSNTNPQLSATLSGSATAITWTKSSGLGTITSPNAVNTSYIVNSGDYSSGAPLSIDFTATTNDPDGIDPLTGPCPAATHTTTVTLNPHLTVTPGSDITVCANQPINLNGNVKIGGIDRTTAGANTWKTYGGGAGTFTLVGPSNFTGTYNPSGTLTTSGTVTPGTGELGNGGTAYAYLISNDPDGPAGPCLADSQGIKIVIHPLPIPHFAASTDLEYCTNGDVVKLQGNLGSLFSPTGASATFTGGTYVTAAGFEYEFDPKKVYALNAGGGSYPLTYTYKDNNACQNYETINVDVYPAPVVTFTTSSRCQGDDITFTESATLNTSVYAGSETDWDWYIDGDTVQNTLPPTTYSLNTPVTHYSFANYGIHNIKLFVTTHSNSGGLLCYAKKDTNLIFGPYPNTGFIWDRPCSVDSVVFTNTTTIPSGYTNDQVWSMDNTIGAYKNATTNTSLHPRFKFSQPQVYNVTLTTTTQTYNCTKSIVKEVFVVPTYSITATTAYDSTFHDGNLKWAPSGTNYSWEWGTPTGKSVINSPDNIWVTNLNGNYNIGELSYLNSPCFNFKNLDKPMMAMRMWSSTRNLAGAMLEATYGNGQPWTTLGQIGDGINWYNTSGVVGLIGASATNPTAQGFSGENSSWAVSRLGLSQYSNQDSLVRFRIVFGSHSANDALNQRDGIALDSIWIGNRSKVVMVEHFTNASHSDADDANAAVDAMLIARPKDMAVIAYHTSTPTPDYWSLFNFSDPGARTLYYGLAGVPRTVVDGTYYNGNVYSGGTAQTRLDIADIDARALETARFDIDLNADISSGLVKVGMKATYTLTDSLFNNIVMHMVVVEDSALSIPGDVSSRNNSMNKVVRKMIPDAAGTVIARRWGKDMETSIYGSWAHDIHDAANLGVVAYIQDHVTREIYQAAYVMGTGTSGSGFVDGTLETNLSQWNIELYPNPAQNEAMVFYGGGANQAITWTLIDAVGQVVDEGKTSVGSDGFVVNTSAQSAGIYTLKFMDENGAVNAKKLVIVK